MNRPPASYLNSSVMGNYPLNWSGLMEVLCTYNIFGLFYDNDGNFIC